MNKGASTVFSLQAHIVLVTKYRKPVITTEVNDFLKQAFTDIGKNHFVNIISWNYDKTTQDHIHVLIDYSPRTQLSGFMLGFKSTTSRQMKQQFEHVDSTYYGGKVWNRGFFVTSVGNNNNDTIQKYIDNQGVKTRVRNDKGHYIQTRHKL